ncbi:MAG: ATP-binding cassette domain-containing protein [Leptospiraceae bacterium]|nr:ATP-binding cassette domain-containing protein [Leptospiraceae bacterium]MCK6382003.1 ATP-binding cassette domain-containing protein [Leptospiraceae bacterium]NUM40374.1 ATP-binding cassette domain-containing protein [Leptospiraceae bacterium]
MTVKRSKQSLKKIIELKDIIFIRNQKIILNKINLTIHQGENWVFLGKNGSGKTTLLNIIYGSLWPTSGVIKVFGKEYGNIPLNEIQKKIGILQSEHQSERLQRNLTIEDIVSTGIFSTIGVYFEMEKTQKKVVQKVLKKFGWLKRKEENYSNLSSGEKKKILLLRAIISNPKILILDEPCSSLDISAREDFFEILNQIRKRKNFTSILITHRPDEIPEFYTHAALIKDGRLISSGEIEGQFTDKKLSEIFSLSLKVLKKNRRFTVVPK